LALLDVPGRLWALGRKIDELLQLQRKTRETLDSIEHRIKALEDRMTRLEAGQEQTILEARSAASAASSVVASAIVSDVVTRITRLEMRLERLPPPEGRG
jgi:chromosome segregation ATPase